MPVAAPPADISTKLKLLYFIEAKTNPWRFLEPLSIILAFRVDLLQFVIQRVTGGSSFMNTS